MRRLLNRPALAVVAAVSVIGAATLVGVAVAQPASPEQRAGVAPNEEFGTMHFQTNLGSFRLIDAHGRAEFTFRGTVLLSQVKGQSAVTGNVTKAFDRGGRQIWTGDGRVVVTGSWRAVQAFGRDLKGVWYGAGVARLNGDFDRNLETGWYWFDDPARDTWMPFPGTGTMDVVLPQPDMTVRPRVRQAP